MNHHELQQLVIKPTLSLLDERYRQSEPDITRILLAIAEQESRTTHRVQLTGNNRNWWDSKGPARGLWQFELNGIRAVLNHKGCRAVVEPVLNLLNYPALADPIHVAIAHNDILACAFARALLWSVPQPLPSLAQPDTAWDQYVWAWRPGKPHRQTWSQIWQRVVNDYG